MSTAVKPRQIGHVIRILDKYTILVDAGKGVLSVGDTIQVYEIGDVINDLNGNPLSYYVHIKDELDVVQVEETYSVCKKNDVVKHTVPFVPSPLLEHTYIEKIPLNVNESELNPLKAGDNIVHIGDAIKLV